MDETIHPSTDRRKSGPDFAKLQLWLLRLPRLSFGAKCLYARLELYAGKNGVCNPSHPTLAGELAVSDRHIRELLNELRDRGLLTWRRTQNANRYRVTPSEEFRVPERTNVSGQVGPKLPISSAENVQSGRRNPSDKKMSLKRGSSRDVSPKNARDYDCPPQNRKKLDSAAGDSLLKSYPELRNCLREHLRETDPEQPSRDKVIRVKGGVKIDHRSGEKVDHFLGS